jgi:methionyl aminopeptidase
MDMPHFRDRKCPDHESMTVAGRVAARTHEYLETELEVGVTTMELDRRAEAYIREQGATPAFHDFGDSSHSITVSLNEDMIHSPPSPDEVIREGDLVSIDLGAKYRGHYSDTAQTHLVEPARSGNHRELLDRTQSALYAGILAATAGNTLRDIGQAIEDKADPFGVVTDWAGHFIGRELHLAPQVHNVAERNDPFQLERGMHLAVEPILTLSADAGTLRRSGERTIRSRSGEPGAHFEHTIRVGRERAEILTARSGEPTDL